MLLLFFFPPNVDNNNSSSNSSTCRAGAAATAPAEQQHQQQQHDPIDLLRWPVAKVRQAVVGLFCDLDLSARGLFGRVLGAQRQRAAAVATARKAVRLGGRWRVVAAPAFASGARRQRAQRQRAAEVGGLGLDGRCACRQSP